MLYLVQKKRFQFLETLSMLVEGLGLERPSGYKLGITKCQIFING